eukprot:353716-Chlamydomonas_euryale.AAC.3
MALLTRSIRIEWDAMVATTRPARTGSASSRAGGCAGGRGGAGRTAATPGLACMAPRPAERADAAGTVRGVAINASGAGLAAVALIVGAEPGVSSTLCDLRECSGRRAGVDATPVTAAEGELAVSGRAPYRPDTRELWALLQVSCAMVCELACAGVARRGDSRAGVLPDERVGDAGCRCGAADDQTGWRRRALLMRSRWALTVRGTARRGGAVAQRSAGTL